MVRDRIVMNFAGKPMRAVGVWHGKSEGQVTFTFEVDGTDPELIDFFDAEKRIKLNADYIMGGPWSET